MGGASQNTQQASNTAQNAASSMNYGSNTGSTYGQNSGQTSTQTYAPSALAQQYLSAGTAPAAGGISQYMNPYQQQVLNSAMQQYGLQAGQTQNQIVGNAISNNALGGDRQAVAQAYGGYLNNLGAGNLASQILSQGYNTSLAASQADQARQLQAAGLSGGTTSGQSLASMLGQQLSSTLGGMNSAQASAGTSAGAGSTTTNPGLMGGIGAGLGLAGLFAKDGGSIKMADGGSADPGLAQMLQLLSMNQAPVLAPAVMQQQQAQAQQKPQSTMQAGYNSVSQPFQMGQKAGKGLSNIGASLFGSSSPTVTGDGGWQTGTQTASAVGSSGLGNTLQQAGSSLSSGLSDLGSSIGDAFSGMFASGGRTGGAPVSAPSVSAPSISMPSISMPSLSAPNVSMPNISMPSMPSVSLPWVPMPSINTGKGSGGAVRGFANGGLARLPFEDGGEADSGDLSSYLYNPPEVNPYNGGGFSPAAAPANVPSPSMPAGFSNAYVPEAFRLKPDTSEVYGEPAPWESVTNNPVGKPEVPGGLTSSISNPSLSPAGISALSSPAMQNLAEMKSAQAAEQPSAPSPITLPTALAPHEIAAQYGATSIPNGFSPTSATQTVPNPFQEGVAPVKGNQVVNDIVGVWKNQGANENAIRGMLANAKDESGFNPTLRHPDQPHWGGEAHFAHGLFQEGGAEWNKYSDWLQQNHPDGNWKDHKLQAEFTVQNLKENYPGLWDKMQNAKTPAEAAQLYLNGYEKPAEQYRMQREAAYGRGVPSIEDFASGIYNTAKSGIGAVASGAQEAGAGVAGGISTMAGKVRDTIQRGFSPDPQEQHPYKDKQDRETGSLLSRMLGINFNPLGLTQKERMALISMGGAMAATGNLGHGMMAYANSLQGTSKEERQAQLDAMRLRLMQSQIEKTDTPRIEKLKTQSGGEQIVLVDPRKGTVNPLQTGASNAQVVQDMESIPPGITGEDFIEQAKQQGYTAADLAEAKRVANYDTDISKLYGIKSDRRAYIDRLAARINPDYRPENYKAAADSTSKLASGDVSKGIRSIGRLFDETEQASSLADKTRNTKSEYANRAMWNTMPSGSEYGRSIAALGTSLNNVVDTASAVAKGGGQGAEGDAQRRAATMNQFQHPETLKAALRTEAEIGLKNGQSNLTSYNTAHGYTPDNPNYKTIMDYMTPAQQKKAIAMLGPDKIEEITGRPVAGRGAASRAQAASAPVSSFQEGQTASGPSGKKLIFHNGNWMPLQ